LARSRRCSLFVFLPLGVLSPLSAHPQEGTPIVANQPVVLATDAQALGGRVIAIDVSAPLKHAQSMERWNMDLTAAIGRLMSVATAVAVVQREADVVAVRIDGGGISSPIEVRLHVPSMSFRTTVRTATRGWSTPSNGSLAPGRVVGTSGTFTVEIAPSGVYSVDLAKGEIGDETAALFAHEFGIPAAAITGEYFAPTGIVGSGLVLILLDRSATEQQTQAAEQAVRSFGFLSPLIKGGLGPRQWLERISSDSIYAVRPGS
jgi:redox-regulated HSP33 family molecular chaperone